MPQLIDRMSMSPVYIKGTLSNEAFLFVCVSEDISRC